MSNAKSRYDKAAGKIRNSLKKNILLIWRLFRHPQVPLWIKPIPLISMLYWLNPIDFVPVVGLTPLDDLSVVLLGSKLFVELAPKLVVDRLRNELDYGNPVDDNGQVIDTTYHFMDDDQ